MKKRMISFILILCMLLSLPCMAADREQPSYVALGDSIAAGYALEGFQPVAGEAGALVITVPEGCFPNLIAEANGYALTNLAVSGDDTKLLLERMNTAQYQEPLKTASLITLTIGSNDILKPVIRLIIQKYLPQITDTAMLTTPGEGALLDGSISEIMKTLQSVNDYLNSAEVKAILDEAVEQYKVNWNTIIDTLKSLNPDAKLIVTNYYNPYSMLNISFGSLNLTIGELGRQYLSQMNSYIEENERNGSDYEIVDVTKTSTNVKLNYSVISAAMFGTEVDITKAVNLDPHPDAAGHLYFAEAIQTALDAAEKTNAAITFPDVPENEWYAASVSFAAGKGLIVGDNEGLFNPNENMTLAQYMTVLYRYIRSAVPDSVPEKATTGEKWEEAARYLNTAMMGGRFETLSRNMTRYEMADITAAVMKALSELSGKTLNTRSTHGFTDVTDNENVRYLESIYGIDGYEQKDGTYTFQGENLILRSEVAKVLYNIMTKSAA